jgi:hypothetical protein
MEMPLYNEEDTVFGPASALPTWRSGAFAGEFLDSYCKDTELEGGSLRQGLLTFASALQGAATSGGLLSAALSPQENSQLLTLAARF